MSELEIEIVILKNFIRMLNKKIRDELRSENSNTDSLESYLEMRMQLSQSIAILNKEMGKKQLYR